MSTRTFPMNSQREYARLLSRTLPAVVHTEKQHDAYLERLEALLERDHALTPAERELASLLTLLIEDFEDRHYQLPQATPIQVLEFLMDQHSLKQKDLTQVFGAPSIVSEVLSGKRELNKDHIERLSKRFHVSPELFFGGRESKAPQFEAEDDSSEVEKLRRSFRPKIVTTLFVGESAPHGETFFYAENSVLYRNLRDSLGYRDFLAEFKARGFYLDDLVLYPRNQSKDEKERKRHRWEAVPSLAQRLKIYKPAAVVAVMRAIEPMVASAMHQASLTGIPLYVTPFPGRQKAREGFKKEMAEIIPKLPSAVRS